ncbi:MAG TPA: arylamine N-acetyltransferase [Opitutaceae bacterium]|jgi:N-hydroxyarylamine O-acetyltransferase
MEGPDIEAYFRRIGYQGGREAPLETLDALLARHICAIPFENVSVLLEHPMPLDVASLERKLVHSRRGGYCFEQNGYLLAVLTSLGYATTPLSARVRWQQPRTAVPPRTHLFVRVDIDGVPWMADVGIGGLSVGKALRMDMSEDQATPWETRRLESGPGLTYHRVLFGPDWADVTEYTGEPMPVIDREIANWWTSTNSASKFRLNLSAALAASGGERRTLLNREFIVRRYGLVVERRLLASPAELVQLLGDAFAIEVPPGAELRAPNLSWD